MSNFTDPSLVKKNTAATQPRRADVHANVDTFHSNFTQPQNASPRGLSARRVSGSGLLGSATADHPSPTLSTSSTAFDEQHAIRLQKAHAPNSRGQPFELSWRVPIDWILKLRAREHAVATKPLQDPGNSITSATVLLNGVPFALRLTRVLRAPSKDASVATPTNGPSSPLATPTRNEGDRAPMAKAFENHFVACHLLTVPGGAPQEDVPSPQATEGSSTSAGGEDVSKDVQLIERHSWERKVSFQAEVPPVAPALRVAHPLIGTSDSSAGATIPRLRRVVEGVVSGSVKVIGFANFVPLRELLSYYILADDEDPRATSKKSRQGNNTRKDRDDPLVVFDLDFKLFVSHAWHECVSRHNLAASMSRQQFNLVGLKNHGSTCYINVLLQSLFHISFFRREVMSLTGAGKRRSEAAVQLQRVFYDLERSDAAVDTLGLLKAIKVNPSIQNDSHEFLSEFFLHRVFKNITDVFSFKVKYLTTCHEVDYSSSSEETLFELSLCVGVKYPTLESAIHKEFAREPIADLYDTGVYEFGKQKASRQMYMVTFPHILFVHSKRFDHYAKKVHASQSFPIRLEVAPSHDYLLHSIIVHHGTGVNSGHFTAFVRVSDAERGAAKASTTPSFFHFDDEAVYSVPVEQVTEEMVGVHWTSPSSSAYILVYVEAEAFDEATTQFDPIPDDVAAMVKRMERTSSASHRHSPPPSSSAATPRAAPSSTTSSPTPSHLSPPLPHSLSRKRPSQQDPSDLSRIMAACRELRGDATHVPLADARRVQVTLWTLPGMRAAMGTLRMVHDLLDLRFAAKYLRQESQLQPSCLAQTDGGGGVGSAGQGSASLWGTDRSALSLALTTETTLEALRQQATTLLRDSCATGKHFNAAGETMLLDDPTDPQHAPHLFLCIQRKNGTWRPTIPLFDVCNPVMDDTATALLAATATPDRGEVEPSAFANTTSTNISGSFTVRKRFEAQGLKVPALRICPPDPSRASQPVTVGDLLQHELYAELAQGASEVLEFHLVAVCPLPIRHAFISREAIVSPSTTSRFSATPGNPYSASMRQRQSTSRGNSMTQFPAMQGGPMQSGGGDDQGLGSASSLGAAVSAPISVVASRVPSTAVAYAGGPLQGSALLPSVQSEDGFRVNPMAAALGDAAAAADTTVVDDELSSEIYRGNRSVSAAGVGGLRMSGSCADSAMLYFKAFDGRQLSLMCAFYVPLDWNVLNVVCTLFLYGYLDWSPYSARGLAAFHLNGMVQSPPSNWSVDECHVFDELRRTLHVFEEVRPERLDAVGEWLLMSVQDLELDHGDILVVECSRAASAVREDRENAFSSSDDEAETDTNGHAPGARLARVVVESCRNVIAACTLLSPLWGILPIGDTVFVLLDLAAVSVSVEELVLLKLQQRAHHRVDGGPLPDIVLALPDEAPVGGHSEGSVRLPNALSPQAQPVLSGNHQHAQKHRMSWWCGDCSNALRHSDDHGASLVAKPLLHHRIRMLKLVPSAQLTDVTCALRQSAPAAALQVGESSAPVNLLTTLFPSATTTLLHWGSLLFTGSAPQEHHNSLHAARSDEVAAPLNPHTVAGGPQTPERSTRLAMGEDTPPPLFDVSASMASQHSQLPWKRALMAPAEDDAPSADAHQLQAASPHRIATLQAQSGMLKSHMSRLFVDLRVPHACQPRRVGGTSQVAALPAKVDVVVTWYGWCRANPTHRFRLREVSMDASAFVVYALAAQFLGFLEGVRPSCLVQGDASLAAASLQACQHIYPLVSQLALAVIQHPPASANEGSAAGMSASSDPNHHSRSGGPTNNAHRGGGAVMIGSIRRILPLSSLQLLHEGHSGCTAPPLRGDALVSDLLRMLRVLPPPVDVAGQNSHQSRAVELALLLMPNTPMDMEECLHHAANEGDSKRGGSASTRSSRTNRRDAGKPSSTGIHAGVEMKRNACMFVVNVVQAVTLHSIAPPGLIPASDTVDELRLWLDQLYPARHHKATRHSRLLVEVYVPPQQEGMHASISDFPTVDPCEYWLSRDVLEYSQHLSDSSKRIGSTSSSTTRHIFTTPPGMGAGSVRGKHAASEEDVVPSLVNHRKHSTAFLDLHEEDPAEYQSLVQRSVMFHYHLMSKSKNGLNPSESFDVKKVLLLFPARLLVVHD